MLANSCQCNLNLFFLFWTEGDITLATDNFIKAAGYALKCKMRSNKAGASLYIRVKDKLDICACCSRLKPLAFGSVCWLQMNPDNYHQQLLIELLFNGGTLHPPWCGRLPRRYFLHVQAEHSIMYVCLCIGVIDYRVRHYYAMQSWFGLWFFSQESHYIFHAIHLNEGHSGS